MADPSQFLFEDESNTDEDFQDGQGTATMDLPLPAAYFHDLKCYLNMHCSSTPSSALTCVGLAGDLGFGSDGGGFMMQDQLGYEFRIRCVYSTTNPCLMDHVC